MPSSQDAVTTTSRAVGRVSQSPTAGKLTARRSPRVGGPLIRSWILAPLVVLALLALPASSALASGDLTNSSCPSESEDSPGFRNVLPDCRAFELVSPVYGAGSVASGVNAEAPLISPDGEELLAVSFGAFAGTEDLEQNGFEYGGIYAFVRTPSGWATEAQEPPASLYPWRFPQLGGFSPLDLRHSVWEVAVAAHPGEEGEDREDQHQNDALFVVREPAGGGKGRFVTVGPVTAPGHEQVREEAPSVVARVSNDLAHIVFSVRGEGKQLWPGDETVEDVYEEAPGALVGRFSSLYEYRGVSGEEPVLVGVRNVGAPPWRGGASHVNEGAQLVSDCGTGFDGMSPSGERVFFTAKHAVEGCTGSQPAVNELYARVNGAETVAMSEPSAGDCTECKESEPMAAGFVGSSEDGSRVFFTSEQELLPGAKGNSLYEYDFAAPSGRRVSLLATDVAGVAAVSKDGSEVYFKGTSVLTGVANGNGEAAGAVTGEKLYAYNTGTNVTSFVAAGKGAESFDATSDGQYLAFKTTLDLKGTNDRSSVAQLFEYDAVTGGLVRVSVGQKSRAGSQCEATGELEEGFGCDGNTTVGEDAPRMVDRSGGSVASDGTVVFSSQLALTPLAVEGAPRETENVYEYEDGQVYLISPGDEVTRIPYEVHQTHTRLLGIDESGKDVFFSTADSLVPQDTDTQFSWYDAREDGGFPGPVSTPGCTGETCQGPLPASPTSASPLATPGANENFVPPAPTLLPAKGTKKKTTKCPKGKTLERKGSRTFCKTKAKPKSKARKATTNRRQSR